MDNQRVGLYTLRYADDIFLGNTCEHIISSEENLLTKIVLNIEIHRKRAKGQPKKRWFGSLEDDQRASCFHHVKVHGRAKWRHRSRRVNSISKWHKD